MDTKKLRQKILDLAIRGKLVPQDPNDEQASVLIEKIRAEKEQLIREKKIKRDKNESHIYRSDKSYYEKLPFGIPNNWIWCKLGEVCNVVRGGSPRPAGSNIYYNGDIPFLKVADLTKSKNMYVDTYQYTIKEAGLTKTRFIKKGTLLLTNSGATLGVPKICGIDATINDGIAAFLDLDDSQIEYLYWFLESQTQNMRNIDQGAAQPNLNTDIIKDFLIPIPPLTEQKRIVSEIKYLLSVIDSLEENKISLEQFISQTKSKILDLAIRGKLVPQDPNDEPASVLLERIKAEHSDSKKKTKNTGDNSHYENLPQGWAECTLEDVGSWSSGATPSRSNKMYYENGTVNWLKTGDLNDSYIDYIPEKITDLALKECSVRLNPKGSVLIAMYGATIGKIGILNTPSTTNQACCACITYSGVYNKFLFYLLMSKKRNLQMKAEGGAQPNISKEKIINFPILLPPSQEQLRIVQSIENLFQQLDSIIVEL